MIKVILFDGFDRSGKSTKAEEMNAGRFEPSPFINDIANVIRTMSKHRLYRGMPYILDRFYLQLYHEAKLSAEKHGEVVIDRAMLSTIAYDYVRAMIIDEQLQIRYFSAAAKHQTTRFTNFFSPANTVIHQYVYRTSKEKQRSRGSLPDSFEIKYYQAIDYAFQTGQQQLAIAMKQAGFDYRIEEVWT